MPFLTLGDLTVKATEFRRLPDETGGGGLRRTLGGGLRGRSDWTKRAWAGTLYAADTAEVDAIRARANPDTDISVGGDAVGVAVTARVAITGDVPYIRSAGTWYYMVPVTVRET